ncbi:MAG: VRR-NUC domain-containing protein [Candidatus Thiodiazotropha sp. (ex Lucinoma aequizonata)]|nr:VRR-NUC domain-containing protein [Candidatus Thiodiazotropha sp. (ex Lucinoma aequizonata)]MCU7899669.1 VRR-NUC domain-containing protein [Candidatus Thiodiazotropha sp. (ex Lucinoma aequizonata)]MCU7901361.1 VRR-NUC domain-containing protein [Candidatus Thiodiazotropha sp. (ex Lucinoma aequizonata)]MCU7910400.1 VRR-NUC domain-containing protein [Candidatus Thiodiazotropha sp. (ex Lucinoma aequizonata)]
MFIYKGRYWFVEFKRKGKRPTTAQIREHDKLRAAGAIVIVVDDYLSGTIIVNIMVAGNSLSLELIIKFLNDVENISTS